MKNIYAKFLSVLLPLVYTLLLSGNVFSQTFTESNLPIVIINTDIDPETDLPIEIVDDPRVLGTMKIIWHTDGSTNYVSDQDIPELLNYNGRMDIEFRGSSSQDLPKKPYGFTTLEDDDESNNNVSLLGMPEENDWVLNSLAFDPSLVRDYLSYNLARLMGNYAPRTEYCEVVINGDYKGLYILQEKIKADGNRVNVVKITDEDNTLPNLSGGYITKADKTTGGDPIAWLMDSYNGDTAFIHDLPKPEDVTAEQDEYIHAQFTALETVMSSDNASITDGYPSLIDVPTFVDYMLSSELASNADSYQLSTCFHKDREGKLKAGPIWDYNLTYGNDLFDYGLDRSHTDVWQFDNGDNTGAKFWKDLFDNATFNCYLSKRFHDLTQPGQPLKHSNLATFIDNTVAYISDAVLREDERWSTIPDHALEIENLKQWLFDRLAWMDSNLESATACSSVTVPSLVISRINYNPGVSPEFTNSNKQEFIEITNAGATTVDLTGIYFRQLGISYQFPAATNLAAGQRLYLASDLATFQNRYGLAAFGKYARNLSNSSQDLVLADAFGNIIDKVEYFDDAPWPDADGSGSYLQLIDTALDNSLASSWIPSVENLGAQDLVSSPTALYPNPVKDILTVSSTSLLNEVIVFDVMGKMMLRVPANSQDVKVDLGQLAKGIYLVRLFSEDGNQAKKVVKQ